MKFAMLICGDDREWSALSPAEEEDLVLEADSIVEAVEVASDWPIAAGMSAIEVRPVMVRE